MANISFNRGTLEQVNAATVTDGQFLVATDSGKIAVDTASGRQFIGATGYSVTATSDQTDTDAIATVATTPTQGDIAVVKRLIADDKYSFTAYIYESGAWAACDGNK